MPERNLSAALFRLEASRHPDEVIRIVHALLDWLKAPEQMGLRRAFAVWFGRVFLPKRLPGIAIAPMSDLFEVHHMLAENVESWTDQWKREGLEQGRDETRHRLTRLARRRFGPAIATRAEPLLAAIHAPQPLEELGEQLLTCADEEEWLNAIQAKL